MSHVAIQIVFISVHNVKSLVYEPVHTINTHTHTQLVSQICTHKNGLLVVKKVIIKDRFDTTDANRL